MSKWKIPPKAKVYEALSAIADDRVTLTGPTTAEVISSSRDKTYLIEWSNDMQTMSSNDNASYWQGYLGYPIIAVLLKSGKLKHDASVPQLLKGVPWKALNEQFKRDYDRVIDHVMDEIKVKGGDCLAIDREVEHIFTQLQQLALDRMQARSKPPKT